MQSLLAPRTDIAFAEDDANRLLPWLLAFMIGLTTLLLAISIGLSSHMGSEHQRLQRTVHIEVPATTDTDAELYDKVVAALKQSESADTVLAIESDELNALLEPWLGDVSADALALPRIIEVTLAAGSTDTVQNALNAVKAITADASDEITVQHFQEWLDDYSAYTTSIRLVSSLLAAVLLACVVGMVVLTARTSLHLHFDTVRILHRIGATDTYITQQFVVYALGLVLKASLIGIAVGGACFLALYGLGQAWASPLMPGLSVSAMHFALIGLLPLFTVGIAALATSVTVKRLLEELY